MFQQLQNDVLMLEFSEWGKFTFRQKTIVGHKQTQTIPLMFDYRKKTEEVLHENYKLFLPYLESISLMLESLDFPSRVKRANIVKLFSHSEISAHTDRGEFLSKTRRLHIPISTNEGCIFIVDGKKQHMAEGEIWEINNTDKIHSVHNDGNTDRIHLIIDVG